MKVVAIPYLLLAAPRLFTGSVSDGLCYTCGLPDLSANGLCFGFAHSVVQSAAIDLIWNFKGVVHNAWWKGHVELSEC
jgi:hypothetical protein